MSKPRVTPHIPIETTLLAPKRALSLGVIGDTAIMIGAMGKKRSAALSGVYRRINWKYWGMRNIIPNIDRKIKIMPLVPVLKAGLRNSRMSSMGSSTRSYQLANRARTTAPIAKATKVEGLKAQEL